MNDVTFKPTVKPVDFASAGPGTPGGILLRTQWQPVHLSRNLKNGDAKPIHVMGERFTLYRGESGEAHVVADRCAHRSTQLSTGWVRGDNIQCYYHGWTYNGKGNCVLRPGERPSGPAPVADIAAYPTREHMGLIYAYFGEGPEPAFPPFPHFGDEGVVETTATLFSCNWFQTYENQIDEAHLAFVHSCGAVRTGTWAAKWSFPKPRPTKPTSAWCAKRSPTSSPTAP